MQLTHMPQNLPSSTGDSSHREQPHTPTSRTWGQETKTPHTNQQDLGQETKTPHTNQQDLGPGDKDTTHQPAGPGARRQRHHTPTSRTWGQETKTPHTNQQDLGQETKTPHTNQQDLGPGDKDTLRHSWRVTMESAQTQLDVAMESAQTQVGWSQLRQAGCSDGVSSDRLDVTMESAQTQLDVAMESAQTQLDVTMESAQTGWM
ncbi:unnamed protein product [Arctogadus glacialis]